MGNKGFLFCILSALFVSSSFIFAQFILGSVQPEQMILFWFLSASIASSIIAFFYNRTNPLLLFKHNLKEGLLLGLLNAVSALLWIFSIKMVGASMSAFLLRLVAIFTIALGLWFLKEKLNVFETIGALLAISGAFVLSFSNGDTKLLGVIIAVFAAASISIHDFIAKIYVPRIKPYDLASIRTSFTLIFLTAYTLVAGNFSLPPAGMLPFIIIGSTMSAVIGYILFFKALERMDISKVAIIRNIDPFIVVVYAFVIFRTLPSFTELLGGMLIVSGVLLSELKLGKALKDLLKSLPW